MKNLENYVNLNPEGLIDINKNQRGNTELGCLVGVLGIMAMPVTAYLGSYIGGVLGWIGGQVLDFLPYVNGVAPWLANKCGNLGEGLSRHELNVELYQTTGSISGFWGGFFLPLKLTMAAFSSK